jgi:hypothetical protein
MGGLLSFGWLKISKPDADDLRYPQCEVPQGAVSPPG